MRSKIGIVTTLILLTGTSCVPDLHIGQRLLTIQILLDDQIVLEGYRGVDDRTPIDEMWDVLESVEFHTPTEDPVSDITVEAGTKCSLEGNVVVRIKHVEQVLAQAELKKLTALAFEAKNDRGFWMIGPADARRVKQSAVK